MTLTLNQGPFPQPALPGFAGTAGLSATQAARPVPRGHPVEGHAPSPHGLPVLRSISVYRHAAVITPVARWALIARGTAYSNRFPVPSGCGLPHLCARSASTLVVSRPAQRSLAVTACRFAESPKRPICLEGSDGFVSSTVAPIATGRSDPDAGQEFHLLKIEHLRTAHTKSDTAKHTPDPVERRGCRVVDGQLEPRRRLRASPVCHRETT